MFLTIIQWFFENLSISTKVFSCLKVSYLSKGIEENIENIDESI